MALATRGSKLGPRLGGGPGSAQGVAGFARRTQKFSGCLVSPTNFHRTKLGQSASVTSTDALPIAMVSSRWCTELRPEIRASLKREFTLALTLGEIVEHFLDVARNARDEHSAGGLGNREEGAQLMFDSTTHVFYFE